MKYKFKTKPYEHQLTALTKSWNKTEYAYFMEMGTGKSKVLIDNISLLYDKGGINAAIIIAPKGVYRNWSEKEIPAHMPDHIEKHIGVWNPAPTLKQKRELTKLFEVTDDLKILIINVEAFSTKKGVAFVEKFIKPVEYKIGILHFSVFIMPFCSGKYLILNQVLKFVFVNASAFVKNLHYQCQIIEGVFVIADFHVYLSHFKDATLNFIEHIP